MAHKNVDHVARLSSPSLLLFYIYEKITNMFSEGDVGSVVFERVTDIPYMVNLHITFTNDNPKIIKIDYDFVNAVKGLDKGSMNEKIYMAAVRSLVFYEMLGGMKNIFANKLEITIISEIPDLNMYIDEKISFRNNGFIKNEDQNEVVQKTTIEDLDLI